MKSRDFSKNLMRRFMRLGIIPLHSAAGGRTKPQFSAPEKADLNKVCETCGGGHVLSKLSSHYSNNYQDNIQEYCPRPLRPISTKIILDIDLRWSRNQIQPPVFSHSESSCKYVKNNFNRGNNFNQTEEQFQPRADLRPPVQSTCTQLGPAPQTHGVDKNRFKDISQPMMQCLRNMQNQSKLQSPNGKFD
ncbi:hypothetical protein Tco_0163202 [Tanacetum coccineum]